MQCFAVIVNLFLLRFPRRLLLLSCFAAGNRTIANAIFPRKEARCVRATAYSYNFIVWYIGSAFFFCLVKGSALLFLL
jgi:hypothetical protein